MEVANLLLRGAIVGLLTLLITQICLHHWRLPSGRWLLALLVGLIAYVTQPVIWPHSPAALKLVWVMWGTAVPAFFWFFCLSLFNDKSRPGLRYWLLPGTYMPLDVVGFLLRQYPLPGGETALATALTFYLPQLLKVVVLGLALLGVLQNWPADLVENRRRLRLALVAVIGVHITVVVVVEMFIGIGAASTSLSLLNAFGISIISLLAVNWLFGGGLAGLNAMLATPAQAEAPVQQTPEAPVSPTEQAWLQQLAAFIERDGGYRENGLTIGLLAQHLSLPEYQLRRLINRHLGFRNFNDYLNHYRIEEAGRRLRDPQQYQVPILTVALEVGYNSLTPFNRAFKARHGTTPSEYRRAGGSTQVVEK